MRRITVGIPYCSNEHQRDCDKEKLLSVIATEYSWIATSFYDSAGKYKLDVNHVSSIPLCNGLWLHYTQNFVGRRQEVRFSFLTTPNRKLQSLPRTLETVGSVRSALDSWWEMAFPLFCLLYFIFSVGIKSRGNFPFAVYLNSKASLWR